MSEGCKTHLQQSRISKFSGGGPPDPPLYGGGEGREGMGREGGMVRGGEGRKGWGREREERGGAHPPSENPGYAPEFSTAFKLLLR